MAITLADALVMIGGDDSPLGQAFAGARKKTEGFVANLGGTIKTLATGAIVTGVGAVATGVVGIGVAATSVSGDVREATANIAADLGITTAEAQRFGDVAANVWGNNFAGSIEEAGTVVAEARRQLGDLADNELQRVTENVFRMGDAFPEAFGDSQATINTAKTLMEQFGLSADEAFDFMTTGVQRGLDANGDFIDSIGEYSNLFADAGFSAEDFFGILESGQQGGVLGTDKIADAVKEMSIILSEGGSDVSKAFTAIGLDFNKVSKSVAAGDEAWADYFDDIVEGLAGIEDPIKRQQAQVAIFGTMAEDLGVNFTDGLSTATDAFARMEGATQRLDVQYSSLSEAAEGFKRRTILALRPLGDSLLGIANSVMPLVNKAFESFETFIGPKVEAASRIISQFFTVFTTSLQNGFTPLEAFRNALSRIVPPNVLAMFDLVVARIAQFADIAGRVVRPIGGLARIVGILLKDGLQTLANNILPSANQAFGSFRDIVVSLFQKIERTVNRFIAVFDAGLREGLTPLQAFQNALRRIVPAETQQQIKNVVVGIADFIAKVQEFLDQHGQKLLDTLFAVGTAFATFTIITTVISWVTGLAAAISAASAALTTAGSVATILVAILGGPVTIAIGLIAALVGLFALAWKNNWLGIRDHLENEWAKMKFVFELLKTFLTETIPAAWQELTVAWNEAIANGQQKAAELRDRVSEAISKMVSNIKGSFEKAKKFVQEFWDSLKGFWEWIKGKVFDFKINLPSLPDWATPGSPTPFEIGVRGIDDALKELKRNLPPTLSQLATGGAPSMAAGAGNFTIQQSFHGPADATTVRKATRDGVLAALRARGKM